MSAQATLISGGRLHLNHGPIDMVVGAFGPAAAVAAAYARARARFETLLDELVAELPALRSPDPQPVTGAVARVMAAAVAPYRAEFITPMAAVAGADADAVLTALLGPDPDGEGQSLTRAYVNNGGDIALWMAPGHSLTAAIAARPGMPDRVTLRHGQGIGGIATSGWGGRSLSFGIADAVTVLARTAAEADAAATMIANRVDLPGHPGIGRRPACEVRPETDLGARPVTVDVPRLTEAEAEAALAAGAAYAEALIGWGLIAGAALVLQGRLRTAGPAAHLTAPEKEDSLG